MTLKVYIEDNDTDYTICSGLTAMALEELSEAEREKILVGIDEVKELIKHDIACIR